MRHFEEVIFKDVSEEIARAQKLHPNWPTNTVEAAAVVVEEAGEALKAALNMRPSDYHSQEKTEPELRAELDKELVQTAAMAIRALTNLRWAQGAKGGSQ